MGEELYLTAEMAAELLGVSVARLSDFVRQRRLRAQRTMCSRQCWYSKLDIDLIILDQIGRAGAAVEALRRSK